MSNPGPKVLLVISLIAFVLYSLMSQEVYFKNVKTRSNIFVQPEPQSRRVKTKMGPGTKHSNVIGMCHELFSIAKSHVNPSEKDERKEIPKKMKEFFKQNFGGATEPYEEISKSYGSLLEKNIRSFKVPHENPTLTNASERQIIKHRMLKNQPEFSYKLSAQSALAMTAGTLPTSPCRLKSKYDPAELTSALTRAVEENNGSLNIVFLGDSKLRDMFLALLLKTRHLNYTVSCSDTSTSLAGALQDLVEDKHLWTTRQATANQVPGLTITHVFESFSFVALKNFQESASVAKLVDWVEGRRKPPDLLVVGYGQWMFYLMMVLKELPMTVLNSLDYLLGADNLVTSLVQKLPKKTLVLFLAQTRQRPHARTEYNVKFDVNSVGNTEWRDSILLQRLARRPLRSSRPQNPSNYVQNSFNHIRNPSNRMQNPPNHTRNPSNHTQNPSNHMQVSPDHSQNLNVNSHRNLDAQDRSHWSFHALYGPKLAPRLVSLEFNRLVYENFTRELYRKFVANLPPYLRPNHTFSNENVAKDGHILRLKKQHHIVNVDENANDGPQILFWDSSLPLNLARIRDCETLYQHDPQTADAIPFILGRKMRALKYEYLLQRMKASDHSATSSRKGDKLNNSASKILQETGMEITSRVEKPFGSVKKKSLVGTLKDYRRRGNYTPSDKDFERVRRLKKPAPDEQYFEDFVKAYSSPELNCLDDLHAGVSTNEIEALQLLNFLSNRHLETDDNFYCCQQAAMS